MPMLKLPAVVLPQDDFSRLAQLATKASADRHPLAPVLAAELERARVTHDRSVLSEVATLNRWLTYRVDWGPTENRQLVHPDDHACPDGTLSVLSSEGAAIVGIGIGDRMPFTDIDGHSHVITLISVDAGPKVVPFRPRVHAPPKAASEEPFDPGPSAA